MNTQRLRRAVHRAGYRLIKLRSPQFYQVWGWVEYMVWDDATGVPVLWAGSHDEIVSWLLEE